jgi:hypothetical protein
MEGRGVLDVTRRGAVTIQHAAYPLQIALRYADSMLTSAESSLMTVILQSVDGRVFTRRLNGGERGRVTMRLPPDTYSLTVQVAPGLESLFPTLPMGLSYPIGVPETETVAVTLTTELISGTLEIDGEPATASQGTLQFVNGTMIQNVRVSSTEPGVFRALMWPHETYDIYYVSDQSAAVLLESDWRWDGEELDFSVDIEPFEVRLNGAGLDLTETSISGLSLSVRHHDHPSAPWLYNYSSRLDDEVIVFEGWAILGETVDLTLNSHQEPFPRGQWRVATEVTLESETEVLLEWDEVDVDIDLFYQDGTRVLHNNVTLYFYNLDERLGWESSIYMYVNNEGPRTTANVFPGEYRMYAYPSWTDSRYPTQRFELGTVSIDGRTELDIDLLAYRMSGAVSYRGEDLPTAEGLWRGSVQYLNQNYGGASVWLPTAGPATYELSVASGTYTITYRCQPENCVEAGLGTNTIVVYDGVRLGELRAY